MDSMSSRLPDISIEYALSGVLMIICIVSQIYQNSKIYSDYDKIKLRIKITTITILMIDIYLQSLYCHQQYKQSIIFMLACIISYRTDISKTKHSLEILAITLEIYYFVYNYYTTCFYQSVIIIVIIIALIILQIFTPT